MLKKAVAYARFSTDMQREESIDAQVRAITEYCQRNNIELIKVFADEGISGTTDSRPQFQEMITKITEIDDYVNFVIVHKLDRFSRNRYDSAVYKRKLKQRGVRVLSVLENLDDSPESVILESVLEGMSEYFSKNLSREVKKGMKENALKSQFNGGFVPFGFRIDENKKYVINEDQAKAVKLVFDMYSKGYTYNEIIGKLTNLGYKTNFGNDFKKTTLHSMLRNERYIGTYIYGKEDYKMGQKRNSHNLKKREDMIILENSLPRIIDEATWNLVQARIKTNSKYNNKKLREYPLSKLLRCDVCGYALVGTSRKNSQGINYFYYKCECKDCKQTSVRADKIEKEFYRAFNDVVFNQENKKILADQMMNYLSSNTQESAEVPNFEKRLKTINLKISNIIEAIKNGMFHISLKEEMDNLEQEKFDLEAKIQSLKNSPKENILNSDEIIEFLNRYDKLEYYPINQQRSIINIFCEKVTYKKNTLRISLKLSECVYENGAGKRT